MKVKLKFNSLFHLWQFKQTVQPMDVAVLTDENVLIGFFNEAEVEMACCSFGAKLIASEVDCEHHSN